MEENSLVYQENNSPIPMGGTLAVNYVGFHSRKQGLHDIIAGTYVVPK